MLQSELKVAAAIKTSTALLNIYATLSKCLFPKNRDWKREKCQMGKEIPSVCSIREKWYRGKQFFFKKYFLRMLRMFRVTGMSNPK